jgi:hypothetical protein
MPKKARNMYDRCWEIIPVNSTILGAGVGGGGGNNDTHEKQKAFSSRIAVK